MSCAPHGNLEGLAAQARQRYHLFVQNEWGLCPNAVMFGWVRAESDWNTWATREEPAFHRRYVGDGGRESWELAISWGLLQVMGLTAREMGYEDRYLSRLCNPAIGLDLGAKYLRSRYDRGDQTWAGALAAYNGGFGGNMRPPYRNQSYVDKVLSHARWYAERAGR